jgi:hypothetical protein
MFLDSWIFILLPLNRRVRGVQLMDGSLALHATRLQITVVVSILPHEDVNLGCLPQRTFGCSL